MGSGQQARAVAPPHPDYGAAQGAWAEVRRRAAGLEAVPDVPSQVRDAIERGDRPLLGEVAAAYASAVGVDPEELRHPPVPLADEPSWASVLRDARGDVSLHRLAGACHVAPWQVARWLWGLDRPGPDDLRRLGEATGSDVAALQYAVPQPDEATTDAAGPPRRSRTDGRADRRVPPERVAPTEPDEVVPVPGRLQALLWRQGKAGWQVDEAAGLDGGTTAAACRPGRVPTVRLVRIAAALHVDPDVLTDPDRQLPHTAGLADVAELADLEQRWLHGIVRAWRARTPTVPDGYPPEPVDHLWPDACDPVTATVVCDPAAVATARRMMGWPGWLLADHIDAPPQVVADAEAGVPVPLVYARRAAAATGVPLPVLLDLPPATAGTVPPGARLDPGRVDRLCRLAVFPPAQLALAAGVADVFDAAMDEPGIVAVATQLRVPAADLCTTAAPTAPPAAAPVQPVPVSRQVDQVALWLSQRPTAAAVAAADVGLHPDEVRTFAADPSSSPERAHAALLAWDGATDDRDDVPRVPEGRVPETVADITAALQAAIEEDGRARVAHDLGVARETLKRYLAGARPQADVLVRLAVRCGLDVAAVAAVHGHRPAELPGELTTGLPVRVDLGALTDAEAAALEAFRRRHVGGRELPTVDREFMYGPPSARRALRADVDDRVLEAVADRRGPGRMPRTAVDRLADELGRPVVELVEPPSRADVAEPAGYDLASYGGDLPMLVAGGSELSLATLLEVADALGVPVEGAVAGQLPARLCRVDGPVSWRAVAAARVARRLDVAGLAARAGLAVADVADGEQAGGAVPGEWAGRLAAALVVAGHTLCGIRGPLEDGPAPQAAAPPVPSGPLPTPPGRTWVSLVGDDVAVAREVLEHAGAASPAGPIADALAELSARADGPLAPDDQRLLAAACRDLPELLGPTDGSNLQRHWRQRLLDRARRLVRALPAGR